MTLIIGLKDQDKIWIGGDSAGSSAMCMYRRARQDPKVFRRGEFLFGFAGSFRMGQLIQYNLMIPEIPHQMDLHEYMVTRFIESMRECFKHFGYMRVENGAEYCDTFLVGIRGRLFTIDRDLQVGEVRDNYDAIGSGREFALGSLATSDDPENNPEGRIIAALEATTLFHTGVCPPFVIGSVDCPPTQLAGPQTTTKPYAPKATKASKKRTRKTK